MQVPQSRLINDRYELEGIVGRGSIGEVYRARDIRLDRVAAIKTLRTDLASDQTFQARFRREAQSAASLNNPSIVAVYDVGEDMSTGVSLPYIVMEYVDGRTVRDLLIEGQRLLPDRALEIISGVLRALDYSHQAGIVHRDIKPGNVMVTRNGDIKVMDFGIARATSSAQVIGTAQYLSPEQARGERVDARSDLYSTGCLMYELLTGRPPFTGDSPVAIAYQHVRENPVPPSRLDPDMPPWADAIVLRAMAKSPNDRYQSAAEMQADIQRAAPGVQVAAIAPVPPSQANSTAPRTQQMLGKTRSDAPVSPLRISPPSANQIQTKPFTTPARGRPVVLKRPTISRISEATFRREEPLGDEVIAFNNAESSSTAVETIRLSRTARISMSVDLTKAKSISGSAGVTFLELAKVQASMQNEITNRYSFSAGSELTFEQTTVVNIPARTSVQVILHWKTIWATGTIVIAERNVEVAEIPFEVTVGLAFDKETRDV